MSRRGLVDAAELDTWTGVLLAAGTAALTEGLGVVTKGAAHIRAGARELAPHGPHTPHYRDSITYEMTSGPGWVQSETGPDWDRSQGPLGIILEYGTGNNAPIPHLEPAGDDEAPRFYGAAEAVVESLESRFGR